MKRACGRARPLFTPGIKAGRGQGKTTTPTWSGTSPTCALIFILGWASTVILIGLIRATVETLTVGLLHLCSIESAKPGWTKVEKSGEEEQKQAQLTQLLRQRKGLPSLCGMPVAISPKARLQHLSGKQEQPASSGNSRLAWAPGSSHRRCAELKYCVSLGIVRKSSARSGGTESGSVRDRKLTWNAKCDPGSLWRGRE